MSNSAHLRPDQTAQGFQHFFEYLGVSGLVVAFLCGFLLKDLQPAKDSNLEDDAAVIGH